MSKSVLSWNLEIPNLNDVSKFYIVLSSNNKLLNWNI